MRRRAPYLPKENRKPIPVKRLAENAREPTPAGSERADWWNSDSDLVDEAGVRALATLPSLDELRGKLIGLIQAPATKIAGVLQAPAGQLARVFNAYATKDAA